MTLREIIAELQSIGYQLDSALDGNSTLQGASSDLNLLLDMLEKQEISEASVTRQKINQATNEVKRDTRQYSTGSDGIRHTGNSIQHVTMSGTAGIKSLTELRDKVTRRVRLFSISASKFTLWDLIYVVYH